MPGVEPNTPQTLTRSLDGLEDARRRSKRSASGLTDAEARRRRDKKLAETGVKHQFHEYPPASTKEGGTAYGGYWLIPGIQNRLHGQQLGEFYEGKGRYKGNQPVQKSEIFNYVLRKHRNPHN